MDRIFPRIPSGCSVAGILNENGKRVSGNRIIRSISVMHERANGLGGGFAGYGIYPRHKDDYSFHLMYDDEEAKRNTEDYLKENFEIVEEEVIPTRPVEEVTSRPLLWRYFLQVKPEIKKRYYDLTEDDIVVKIVMHINAQIRGSFVVSSGKNMGVFKGIGFPEDIAKFYRIEEYKAYLWTAHGRFPTNTPGWWGGAHPFGLLDWTLVHNGEISSYGINKRYLESLGYRLVLQTDSEAILYLFDLFRRRHGLPLEMVCRILAAPFWSEIERMSGKVKRVMEAIRMVYGSALINGPSSLIFGYSRGMLGLNDRVKLRPLMAARKGKTFYLSSEECGIREICPKPDKIWSPAAGEPAIGELQEGLS